MRRLLAPLFLLGTLTACGTTYGSYLARSQVHLGPCLSSSTKLEDRTGKPVLRMVEIHESPYGRWVALTAGFDQQNRNPWHTLYLLDIVSDRLHAVALPEFFLVKGLSWSPDGRQAAATLGIRHTTFAVFRLGDPPEATFLNDSRPPDRLKIVWKDGVAHLASILEDGGVVSVGDFRIRTWNKSSYPEGITKDLEDASGKTLHYDVRASISPRGRWAALLVPEPGGLANRFYLLDGSAGSLTEIDARPQDVTAVHWSPDGGSAAVVEGIRDTTVGRIQLTDPPVLTWVGEDPRPPERVSIGWADGAVKILPRLEEKESVPLGRFRLRTRGPQTDLEDEKGTVLLPNVEFRISPTKDRAILRRRGTRARGASIDIMSAGKLHHVELPRWPEIRTVRWSPDGRSAALLIGGRPTKIAVIEFDDPPTIRTTEGDPRDTSGLRLEWPENGPPRIEPPPELVETRAVGTYRIRTWAGPGDLKGIHTLTLEDAAGTTLRHHVSASVSPDGRWGLILDENNSTLLVIQDRGAMREIPLNGRGEWRTVTWSLDSSRVALLVMTAPGNALTVVQRGDPPEVTRPQVDHRFLDFLEVRWKEGEGFRVVPR